MVDDVKLDAEWGLVNSRCEYCREESARWVWRWVPRLRRTRRAVPWGGRGTRRLSSGSLRGGPAGRESRRVGTAHHVVHGGRCPADGSETGEVVIEAGGTVRRTRRGVREMMAGAGPVGDGGNAVVDGGESVVQLSKTIVDGGPTVVDGAPSVVDGGKSVVVGGTSVVDGAPSVVDGGTSVVDERAAPAGCRTSSAGGLGRECWCGVFSGTERRDGRGGASRATNRARRGWTAVLQ